MIELPTTHSRISVAAFHLACVVAVSTILGILWISRRGGLEAGYDFQYLMIGCAVTWPIPLLLAVISFFVKTRNHSFGQSALALIFVLFIVVVTWSTAFLGRLPSGLSDSIR